MDKPTSDERLTRERLLAELRALQESGDPERAHAEADDLLLRFIDDPEVAEAFDAVPKWYA